jgi:NADPH:quinone reductase-like Zn-dependent oxidoreductase
MRAVVIETHGGPESLQLTKFEPPEIGPDQALVRVKAIGLNHLDVWVRKGVPGHVFPLPLIPGSDGAGVVQQVGKLVKNVAVGDEVIVLPGVSCGHCVQCLSGEDMLCRHYGILGESRDGTCAELIAVPSVNLALKPSNFGFVEAGCFALTFQTAHHMLRRRAQLQTGETVLIHAAGSGVGSAGLQIAKLCGARVIALAGGEAKCQRAKDLGADHVIDTKAGPFVPKVKELTSKRGVDVVFEHVGATTFNDSIACLTKGGRLVTCGATTGAKVEIHLAQLFFKSLSYLGSTMGSKGDLHRLIQWAGEGRLRPIVAQVLPLQDIGEAHRLLEAREVFGKVVLEP